jgi:predicted CopG family antitoxin
MVTISITAEAFAALAATLPVDKEADACPDGKGGHSITLPHDILAKLKAMRRPGESYSDVILRVTHGERLGKTNDS